MARAELLSNTGITIPPVLRDGALFEIWIDHAQRIIRTQVRGAWTLADATDYLSELADAIAESRRRFGCARVLCDGRGSPVQSVAVAERLGEANSTFYGEDDKLALVVDSSLLKAQMRRRFTHAGSQAFLSYTAAELWLTAWP